MFSLLILARGLLMPALSLLQSVTCEGVLPSEPSSVKFREAFEVNKLTDIFHVVPSLSLKELFYVAVRKEGFLSRRRVIGRH